MNLVETNIGLLNELGKNKAFLIPLFLKSNVSENNLDTTSNYPVELVASLMLMKVTNLSRFGDDIWDYNEDVINPARSVVGAKLRMNFVQYSNIPPYVMTEMKCLFHYVLMAPASFTKDQGSKKSAKKSLKPNTVIAQFEGGLRYLNFVFKRLNKHGVEFIQDRYRSVTDIMDADFRKAAQLFTYRVDDQIHQFLKYLSHPFAARVLGEQMKVDFTTLQWPEQNPKKRKERLVFENDVFEQNVYHSTQKIVGFLLSLEEEVQDKVALSHYEYLSKNKRNTFDFTKDIFNDYVLIRLLTKGYSDEFISQFCDFSKDYLNPNGKLKFNEEIRKIAKAKYGIEHFDDLRKEVNEVYYACAYIIGQFSGMRPSESAEVKISSCLVVDNGFDVICSNVKKNKLENLKLFDDKWVAIPIMKDALRAALLISQLKNNDYLFSNVDTVNPDAKSKNMAPGGIANFFNNYFSIIYGEEKAKEIKFNAYMLRHTLAYQLHRAELGLPFISFQLKHVVDVVGKYTSFGSTSGTTLGYGEIAERITQDKAHNREIRHLAEVERIKSLMDPNGTYVGPKAKEHKARITAVFRGYIAAGYTPEEVFDAMAEQGMAVINVGGGFCFGGVEDFDESLPCIGSLRCNPIRCSNAIVSQIHAPKWREIVITNRALLKKEGYEDRQDQLLSTIREAEEVLRWLGEEIIL
ncbi:site-specific integrase [Neptunicella marina]|uniref:Site-specific integrase n=1 Tax=Neptunicella marina TaxID=2125989 RepID=A0A8J6IU47_9ALTE|nr:site-specific integrase [Neptunicella marina]MBC3766294.1 site-specific integrase [Neptunicella marina]